jgi:aryl-alcohol dehydrogenase-like predicted oxidoreductase
VAGLQIEYSLMSRGIEAAILPAVRELGVGITAYGIMSRGLLSSDSARAIGAGDPRARFPRFQGDNLRRNLDLLGALEQIAAARGVSTAQRPSPGCSRAAATSSRSSGRSAGTGWPRPSARSS